MPGKGKKAVKLLFAIPDRTSRAQQGKDRQQQFSSVGRDITQLTSLQRTGRVQTHGKDLEKTAYLPMYNEYFGIADESAGHEQKAPKLDLEELWSPPPRFFDLESSLIQRIILFARSKCLRSGC